METILGIAGAGIGMTLLFALYLAGAAGALQFFDQVRPKKGPQG